MNSEKIRQLFLDFFKERGHTIVPSSSLISDDPSVLFTTAGMQQFKPYYFQFDPEITVHPNVGKPVGKNAVSVQKCFRTSDIDAVGDEIHLTFLEMLGNFSFGGYFKKEAIEYAYAFITKKLGLKINYVSVFSGYKENDIPPDEESEKIWKKIDNNIEIKKANKEENFWGPTGDEGPCGPTTEIYINNIEVWNIVFNEYYKNKEGKFTKLKTPGVDTGMGLERLAMVVQNKKTVFETDLFEPLVSRLNELAPNLDNQVIRILTDHLRASVFLIANGVRPSNKEAGYVLRRLLRRILAYQIKQDIHVDLFPAVTEIIKEKFNDVYPEVKESQKILSVLEEEKQKFQEVISRGIKEIEKYPVIDGAGTAYVYKTFGLPFDLVLELAKPEQIKNWRKEDHEREFKKHQEISRAGLDKKFGGHGLKENGEIIGASPEEKQKIIKLHTATHLLHQALGDLFGNQIKQMGSDITSERLRFDFPFERKLTAEEIAKLERIVNQKIKESLPVKFEEKPKEEAMAGGAKAFFKAKYPDQVKVYSIGDYSQEICNGPHVKNTSEIGKFKILKEESVGAGIRRIRATVE